MIAKLDRKSYTFDKAMTVRRLLEQLGLDPEQHLVSDGADLLTNDLVIEADREVRIIRVVSGG